MEIQYPPKRAAQILGLTLGELNMARRQESYTPEDVYLLRQKLSRHPPSLGGQRRQLFLNFKGGTGKTSLSSSYAFRLAEMGYRVLIMDLDSQGHACKCLGLEGEAYPKTLLDVLVKKAPFSQVIVETGFPNLHLVPSNLRMSTIDLALMPMSGREYKLRNALKELDGRYDVVVFDAPPSFGLLNLNALIAADDLFVPVLADFLSFHGLKLLFETVQGLEDDLGHNLANIHIVVNAYNPVTRIAREAKEALENHYKDFLLETTVRQCTKFAQASSEGRPIFVHDPESKGATDLQALIDEVLAVQRAPRRAPTERAAAAV